MKGSATVTPSTGGEQWMQGKNDVFLPVNAEITIEGNLIPVDGGMAARITPERYETIRQVLDGDITTGSNYTKFTVTPPNDSELWEIDSNGCLEKQ